MTETARIVTFDLMPKDPDYYFVLTEALRDFAARQRAEAGDADDDGDADDYGARLRWAETAEAALDRIEEAMKEITMDVLTERTCPDCQGTGCGRLPDDCTTCSGTGAVPAEAMQAVADAALHVTKNVYRQGVPHTRGPDGSCCDDCVLCWAAKLWAAVVRTEAGQAAFLADTERAQ